MSRYARRRIPAPPLLFPTTYSFAIYAAQVT